MTNKTKLSILTLCIAIISLSCIFLYKIQLLKEEIEVKDAEMSETGILYYKLDYLESNLNANIQYNGKNIIGAELQDLQGHSVHFGNILTCAPVLVYRYTELNCQECILFGMLKLKEMNKNDVVLLSHYHDFYLFRTQSKALNNNELAIYNISSVIDLDTLNIPYYFMLHENNTVSDVFMPDKMFPEITKGYLSMIKQKYYGE